MKQSRLRIVLLPLMLALTAAFALPARAGWWPEAAIDFPREPYRIHLRKGPGTSTESLGEFYSGTVVTVYTTGPDWCQVEIGAYGMGYMQTKYLKMFDYEPGTGNARPYTVHDARPWAAVANPNPADRLQQRREPSEGSTSWGKHYNGTPVRIEGEVGDWSYVRLDEPGFPSSGFMLTKYLRRIAGPEASASIGARQGQAVVVNPSPADRLHLRKEPDRAAPSLGKYYTGVVVDVLPYDAGAWALVRVGETVGYMLKDYLLAENVSTVTPAIPTRTVTGEQAVPLREGAMKSSPEVGAIPAGSRVEVLGLAGDWTHIRYEGQIGYVPAGRLS